MTRPLRIVLVAVLVLLVAFGLLTRAVHRARETAARTHCRNALHRLASSALGYADANEGRLPPGYLSGDSPDFPDLGRGWGWGTFLCPYVESPHFYKSLSLAEPIDSPANVVVLPTAPGRYWFECPAEDDAPSHFFVGPRSPSGDLRAVLASVPTSNYVGSCGTGSPADATGDGLLFRDSRIRLADIADGTATTILFGERLHADGPATWVGVVKGSHVAATSPDLAAHPPVEAECAVMGRSSLYGDTLRRTRPDQFSSNHPGGFHLAFADGRAAFIGVDASPAVLRALSTRNGGEVVPSEF